MVRVMRENRVRIWVANARNLRNKIDSVRETLTKRRVRPSQPKRKVIESFKSFRANHEKVTCQVC